MGRTFAVLGSGRQGTAAAYDLILFERPERLILADADADAAQAAAHRLERLTDFKAEPLAVDGSDRKALVSVLAEVDVMVCGLPFVLIPTVTEAAITSSTSMVDLGGHTATVMAQLDRSPDAEAAGVSIVPDCGMGPGLNNTLGMYVFDRLGEAGAEPMSVRLFDGGLPQDRPPPWSYNLFFHIDGLTNEYDGEALFLRQGKVTPVPAMTEPETIVVEGVGALEAFVTSGGTSTVPYTLEGQLQTYENKTLRYPGHYAQFKAFKDLGLFEQEPVGGVVPRDLYHRLLEPQLESKDVRDICVMRAVGSGHRNGESVRFTVDLVDRYDPETGFLAIERLTGGHAAIMTGFIARGEVAPGVHRMEKAVPAGVFMDQVRDRGFEITETWGPAVG